MEQHEPTLKHAGDIDAAAIERIVDEIADKRHCPTLAWGVVIDGSLATTGAVGDVTDQTVYRIASMTKSFAAAATLLLRDEGALRLDDPVVAHAPELESLAHGDPAPITVRDLLTMTSGLPTDDHWADRHLDLTDDEFDRIISDGTLFAHSTGDAWEYSNFGYALLGRVVHRATGQRIQDVISERLLTPLAMTNTTWVQPDHDDWARPMRWQDDQHLDELPPLGDGLIAPMGGIWTNVADLATWVTWLDDAFPARTGGDDGPLRRSSRRAMQSPHRYVGQRTNRGVQVPGSYGFGIQVVDDPKLGTMVAHSGGLPGYGSNMRWLPGRRIGAIALANVTYAPMSELTALILDELDEQGFVAAEATPTSPAIADIAPRLIALLNDWDDGVAAGLCTQSLVLDDDFDRRRIRAERLSSQVGRLTIISIEPATGAQATVRCEGAAGSAVAVTFLLAPPSPPRIQSYSVDVTT